MNKTRLNPGILSQPDNFELTERERALLRELHEWGEQSRRTHWVLGEAVTGALRRKADSEKAEQYEV